MNCPNFALSPLLILAVLLASGCQDDGGESESQGSGDTVSGSTSTGQSTTGLTSTTAGSTQGSGTTQTTSDTGSSSGSSAGSTTTGITTDGGSTSSTQGSTTASDAGTGGTDGEDSSTGGCSMGEADWDYAKNGPEAWADLDCDWQLCGEGREQSPINIPGQVRASVNPDLAFDYVPSGLHLEHRGPLMVIEYDPGSELVLDGRSYELKEIYYHVQSEHSIDGGFAPMELHLEHRAEDGSILMVAVFVEVGGGHPAMQLLAGIAPENEGERFDDPDQFLSAMQLLPTRLEHYKYKGSLSFPPCTEDVTWLVMARSIKAADGEISRLSASFRGHRRPIMPLNNRTVVGGGG